MLQLHMGSHTRRGHQPSGSNISIASAMLSPRWPGVCNSTGDRSAFLSSGLLVAFLVCEATASPSALLHFASACSSDWARWSQNKMCETEFPSVILQRTTAFDRLLVLQTLRPDRLVSSMEVFVCEYLGLKSVIAPSMSLERLHHDESSADEPILFITSPGADPSAELEEFAKRTVGAAKYRQLAMGQGQSNTAVQMLREAARSGEWLCLKNIHLVIHWLPTLEKELYSLAKAPSFRLWLTTEAHPKFPPILLQQSLKLTVEAPPGIKKNLLRSYEIWSKDFVESGSLQRAQLLFVLAWFHAIVQERRKFIPQGWTKFYEFSAADLRSGADIISGMDCSNPKWPTIHGLFVNAIYGGRVDNDFDVRLC
jgi:dynein heavy chain 2